MDTKTFANTIRTKYPDGVANDGVAYKDMADDELTHRVVTKYPVYKPEITDYRGAPGQSLSDRVFSREPVTDAQFRTLVKDAGVSAVDHTKEAIMHPIETGKGFIKGAGRTAVDTADLISSGLKAAGVPEGTFFTPKQEDVAKTEEKLQYSNKSQEAGGFAEGVTELVYGGGKGKKVVADELANLAEKNVVKNAAKAEQKTIEALNPELSGKKLESAYKEVVTAKSPRTISPSGIFSEQTLSPSERTINLGKRLTSGDVLTDGTKIEPIILQNKPVKDLPVLRKSLVDTETKLQTALKGNPEINYNADKQTLFKTLTDASKTAPEEFRIGDASKMYDSVFKFANRVAQKSEDSISGIREARTAFDTQAKLQYPGAFKDGAIDVKSPAGAAIKKARDIFNEHLYNTAPNGSDIQKLIGREADIYQATEPIAANAAKGEGKTSLKKAIDYTREHPVIGAAGVVGAYETAKSLLTGGR
jgi:hypothetical protein